MVSSLRYLLVLSIPLITILSSRAASAAQTELNPIDSGRTIEESCRIALASIQQSVAKYPTHRRCFSCHHQTLPALAMVHLRAAREMIDDKLLSNQAQLTLASFRGKVDDLKAGKNIGGRAMTVGYGLWMLDLAGSPRDATIEAMVDYLLKTQDADGHWSGQGPRPPMEESSITATVLATWQLNHFATSAQRQSADAAIHKAKDWLAKAPSKSQEDKAMALWGMHTLGFDAQKVKPIREGILQSQRADGGWAQLDTMDSDAYATGQTLLVLLKTGLSPSDPIAQRAIQFLIRTQRPDGSWHVNTRSKPIQPYFDFDDEDPHQRHQFISLPATCWAAAALAAASPQRVDPHR